MLCFWQLVTTFAKVSYADQISTLLEVISESPKEMMKYFETFRYHISVDDRVQ